MYDYLAGFWGAIARLKETSIICSTWKDKDRSLQLQVMEMLSKFFLTLPKTYYLEINDLYDHMNMACEALELKLDKYVDNWTTMPTILSFIVQSGTSNFRIQETFVHNLMPS